MHTSSLLIAVVFYYPRGIHIDNFLSISSSIGSKLAFLNSVPTTEVNEMFISSEVLTLGSGLNVGLSAAYNQIFNYAQQNNFEYVLLLDQDSYIDNPTLLTFTRVALNFLCPSIGNQLGTISITPLDSFSKYKAYLRLNASHYDLCSNSITVSRYNINSCSIVPVFLWNSIGGYDEDLFVDRVDFDFCSRVRANNFKVYTINGLYFYQPQGERKYLFFNSFGYNSYPPSRHYSIMRSRLTMYRKQIASSEDIGTILYASILYYLSVLRHFSFIVIFDTSIQSLRAAFSAFLSHPFSKN